MNTTPQLDDDSSRVQKSIDQLIKEDNLKQAMEEFAAFINRCNDPEIAAALAQTQARLSNVEKQNNHGVLSHTDSDTERNKIRFAFQEQLANFRQTVLAKYFELHGEAEFLGRITSRDQVFLRILDLRLLPKRYERDKNWEKVEGNSSIIYRLFNPDTERHAIAMVIKVPSIEPGLVAEIRRLTDLRHRNVIKLLDHEINTFPYFVITEYVYGENLIDALDTVGPRPVPQAADWLYQLADALDYLRQKRILHTNVRPSKIYIDDEWQIMISPFDLIKASVPSKSVASPQAPLPTATEAQPQEFPGERTLNRYRDVCQYGSPELFERDGEGFGDTQSMCVSDMYSLGLVGYKILTGEELFEGKRLNDILESRRRFDLDESYRNEKLAKLPEDELSNVIRNLLGKTPQDRLQHFKSLRDLIHVLNPLTQAEEYDDSEVQKSYRRCLAGNREFIRDFYAAFFEKTAYAKDFDDMKRKRQSAMLQMAVDVLLDLDKKKDYLSKLISSSNKHHAKYQAADFELFINVLIETIQKYDRNWDETIQAEWHKVRDQAMQVVRKARKAIKPEL